MSRSHWRGARRSSHWPLRAMLILAAMGLTACGSIAAPVFSATPAAGPPAADRAGAPAADSAGPADLALCADPASATRVVISWSSHLHQIEPAGSLPPAQAVVVTPVRVRELAKALCALPKMGTGVFSCPAQFERTYMLRFTADGRHLPVVTAQESGCEIVSGLGPARSASKSRQFWVVLATTLAVASPVRPLLFPDNPPRRYCQIVPDNAVGSISCPQKAAPGRSPHK